MGERVKNRYILIDGHSLAYRAFYALPPDLSTSSGQMTNAVYGFVSMLLKTLDEFQPDGVLVAFDKGKATYRLEQFADYKAQRPPMPDELREQIEIIRGLLDVLNIARFEQEGYEADDLLATLAKRIEENGGEALIVTADKDALQLVNENIKVVSSRKGITDIVVYNREKVMERYGVPPEKIVDFLALKGDASDNIPGVPGIGDKTSAALVKEFGSLDELYARLDEVKNSKLKMVLKERKEEAYLGRNLATLVSDLPLEKNFSEFSLRPWDREKVREAFELLEFRTLLERLNELYGKLFPQPGEVKVVSDLLCLEEVTVVIDVSQLESFSAGVLEAGELVIWMRIQGSGFTGGTSVSAAVLVGKRGFYFPLPDERAQELFKNYISSIIKKEGIRWIGHQAKEVQIQLLKAGLPAPVFHFDTELAAYLLDPSSLHYGLEILAKRYLGIEGVEREPGQLSLEVAARSAMDEDLHRLSCIRLLVEPLRARLEQLKMEGLLKRVELPLQRVLALMEQEGVKIDVRFLSELSGELNGKLEGLRERIYELAGERFNVNSPQQLSKILFERLGLPPVKKTKTGYATDVEALETLKGQHPIIAHLLEYRELSKLKGTYLDALPRMVNALTGKLHTSFNQTVTATGRLSSSNPNLQNIPVRTDLGSLVRQAFIPSRPENYFLVADYSQVELRILAHMSGDENLIEAFSRGVDIHAATAAEVFGLSLDQITPEHRRRAKAINFGLIYGISPYGLARQIEVSDEEAREYMERYFARYPGVKEFLDRQVEEAASRGYVETILGRRREIPELLSGNGRMKSLGGRLAMNSPIQGSAADIIKLAMVAIQDELEKKGYRSKLILQVHDELVFDADPEELNELKVMVKGHMENVVRLRVPLKVDLVIGKNWKEAKG